MASKEILEKIVSLSPESVSSILDVLKWLKIPELTEAQAFPERDWQTIEVKDLSGRRYYFGLSEYGFVEIVRSDAPTGKIIYVPLDD